MTSIKSTTRNSLWDKKFVLYLPEAMDSYFDNKDLHKDSFSRPHIFQSIILAIISLRHPDRFAGDDLANEELIAGIRQRAVTLEILDSALSEPQLYPGLLDFVEACSKKTNVEGQKRIRFAYFREALR